MGQCNSCDVPPVPGDAAAVEVVALSAWSAPAKSQDDNSTVGKVSFGSAQFVSQGADQLDRIAEQDAPASSLQKSNLEKDAPASSLQQSNLVKDVDDLGRPNLKPDRTPVPTKQTEPDLLLEPESEGQLKAKLVTVFGLCQKLKILEAGTMLLSLEKDVERLHAHHLLPQLQTDPILVKLRAVYGRMESALCDLVAPCQRDDVEWTTFQITDPALPEYRLDIKLRFAEGSEHQEGGPASQFIVGVNITNFPMEPLQRIALEREANLFQKKWVKDCEDMQGSLGGSEQLYSVLFSVLVNPWLIPFKFEDVALREFSVCQKPPRKGLPAGFMKIETSPPDGVQDFEGWRIPDAAKGAKRNHSERLFLISPSADNKKFCNVQIFASGGLNVPRLIIPLWLVKRLVGIQISAVLKNIREMVLPAWDQLGYNERIEACPEFYGPVKEVFNYSSSTPN